MKKLLLILVVSCLVTGCGKDTLTCTRSATISDGVKMELNYKIISEGEYVQIVESEEKIITDDKDYLNTYKSTVENVYAPYRDVKYYDNEITIGNGKLVSTTKIDYSKIDTKKLIEIDSANAQLIKDGKVKVTDVKELYESIGAICK